MTTTQTTQCTKCQMAMIDPTHRPSCGHPAQMLVDAFGYTPEQAAAWAAVTPLAEIVAMTGSTR